MFSLLKMAEHRDQDPTESLTENNSNIEGEACSSARQTERSNNYLGARPKIKMESTVKVSQSTSAVPEQKSGIPIQIKQVIKQECSGNFVV